MFLWVRVLADYRKTLEMHPFNFPSSQQHDISKACIIKVYGIQHGFIYCSWYLTFQSKRKMVLSCCIILCEMLLLQQAPLCVLYMCVCIWMCTKLHVVSSWISPESDLTRSCTARLMGHKAHIMSNHLTLLTFHLVCTVPLERWPVKTSKVCVI